MLPENTIICGDCIEVMRDWPDKCVDLVLTDPPYGINYQSARRTDKSQWKPKIDNDTSPFVAWLPTVYQIIKNSGRLICFDRWDVEDVFRAKIAEAGFVIKSQIIWDKVIHGMGDLAGEFAPCHENALYATKGRFEFVGNRPKTIFRHTRVSPEKLVHPNEKPVELLCELIKAVSSENDLILDPFCGSGTTCVAAKMLGRRYIGIDISSDYCRIAEERLKAVDTGVPVKEARNGQLSLLGANDGSK